MSWYSITQLILDLRPFFLIMSYAKRWCFTLNNPTDQEQIYLAIAGEEISIDEVAPFSYLIFGRETGESGTPHLQGFAIFKKKTRLTQIKNLYGFERCHLEVARGTAHQAATYCKKDGDFDEYGKLPAGPGNASSFEALRDWVSAQETCPTYRDIWETFPSLAGRYKGACMECIELFGKRPQLVEGELREWQSGVDELVSGVADDRRVIFVVDPEGNSGKSWLCRYWMSHRNSTQFLSVGKRDDLAYSVNTDTDLFVFDIPRGSMEYLQYGIFEQLKNRVVYSPKYTSMTKILNQTPHVVVFCNEEPDMDKLTADRYHIINI